MKLSAAQLQAMDPDTREQVMRVRRDLGLGEPSQSSSRNASPANAFTDSGGDRARRQHSQQRQRQSREYEDEDDYSQI